jgi:hypothetical protein
MGEPRSRTEEIFSVRITDLDTRRAIEAYRRHHQLTRNAALIALVTAGLQVASSQVAIAADAEPRESEAVVSPNSNPVLEDGERLDDEVARARTRPVTPPRPLSFAERYGSRLKPRKARKPRLQSPPAAIIDIGGYKPETMATNGHGDRTKLLPSEADWLLARFPDGMIDEANAALLNAAVTLADIRGIVRGSAKYFELLTAALEGHL